MIDLLSKLFLLLVGCGFGFCVACIGAANIIVEKKELKDELEQIKGERDFLANEIKKNTKTIEITDTRTSTTGDYFEPF